MTPDRLVPYARLPCAYHDLRLLHSTVDASGRAHWLLRTPADTPGPYDAVVVTVGDGTPNTTVLGPVSARHPRVDALPDGGFVVADARSGTGDEQVQVFDALGRPSWTFRVGDAIEHLLTDESGDLWIGYFDEGVFGDPLSAAGARRWSATGEGLWEYVPPPGGDGIADCYALNVDRRAAWVYPYTSFPLVEVRDGRPPLLRTTTVRGASGVAVDGERVAFLGGYGRDHDRLVLAALGGSTVDVLTTTRLAHADGTPLERRRHVVSRGPRLYVRERSGTEWGVLDIGGS
ncbi:hypothetical protein [Streptomyces heilongjiangensis]|uniref:Uncharacterized protein n=1 Tax=Streptomyces heilongjiangensis TaxID=945052 RepID=A0ABW1BG68_9ACTN|nr:hypothetical protein [Streptomyces heilongjiangensis]MDC2949582.1 hypothetical protein [Streptomyces heilongjiangensis]